jgi:hypothetical protein
VAVEGQVKARDGARDGVGNKNVHLITVITDGEIPRALDEGIREGLNQVSFAIDEEERTRERHRHGEIAVGKAISDKDETRLEHREARAQTERCNPLQKQGGLSGRSDADNGDSGSLKVLVIVEVRDQDVAPG